MQADIDSTAVRETSLLDEKYALKAALSAAISQKEEAVMVVAEGARELAALSNECTNLRHQVRVFVLCVCVSDQSILMHRE
jgi:hypothetical protein